jgi:hypothetical protein
MECPKNAVLDLNKAIYGLKQAPLAWYKRLAGHLKSLGFQTALSNPCVYWRNDSSKSPASWIFAHVDDLVIISHHLEVFKEEMERKFEIKYLGEAVFLLGMNIERFEDGLQINQTQYVERKLLEFDLHNEHPALCPLNPKEPMKKATEKKWAEFEKLGVNF